jgi:hypothetical protein
VCEHRLADMVSLPDQISGTGDGLIDRRTPDKKGFIVHSAGGATTWLAGMRPTSKGPLGPAQQI